MFPGETVLSSSETARKNPHIGPFKAIQSQGSGLWYIGTMFICCGNQDCSECGKDEYPRPNHEKGIELDFNSRETDYFDTEEQVNAALDAFNKTGEMPKQRY